jgi:hypothetical protein
MAMLTRRQPGHPHRGAASLVVVMVLFFIITLVAAYTSRNLLFEQRTSTNQYRSTLAFETAEAGVEWALARLNDARMNNNCTPLTSAASVTTQESFRQRYLGIAVDVGAGTSTITPLMQPAVLPATERLAGCVFDGVDWVCDCPATGEPNPAVAAFTGNGPFAAFWVRFQPVTGAAAGVSGVVWMQVNACTRFAPECLRFNRQALSGDGLATVWTMVALRGAAATLPAAAVTASGAITRAGGTPVVSNTDLVSGGLTMHSGSTLPAGVTVVTIPGTPPSLSTVANDAALVFAASGAITANDRMFNSVFGMLPATFDAQPGVADVNCSGDCDATDVNNAVLLHPGHVIRLRDLGAPGRRLRIGANIGTVAAPVVVVADPGINVEFDGVFTLNGLVYSRAANWQLRGGNGTLVGAAVAEQAFEFNNDNPAITYSRDVLLAARFLNGSFVKVPGGWRDFQP